MWYKSATAPANASTLKTLWAFNRRNVVGEAHSVVNRVDQAVVVVLLVGPDEPDAPEVHPLRVEPLELHLVVVPLLPVHDVAIPASSFGDLVIKVSVGAGSQWVTSSMTS